MIAFGYVSYGSGHLIQYAINVSNESDLVTYAAILAMIYPGVTWVPQYLFPPTCWISWVRDTPEGEWYNPNPAPESHSPDLS